MAEIQILQQYLYEYLKLHKYCDWNDDLEVLVSRPCTQLSVLNPVRSWTWTHPVLSRCSREWHDKKLRLLFQINFGIITSNPAPNLWRLVQWRGCVAQNVFGSHEWTSVIVRDGCLAVSQHPCWQEMRPSIHPKGSLSLCRHNRSQALCLLADTVLRGLCNWNIIY